MVKKKKPYEIKVKYDKGKFTKKQLKIRKLMATAYASSPYKSKKSKDKDIKSLFK